MIRLENAFAVVEVRTTPFLVKLYDRSGKLILSATDGTLFADRKALPEAVPVSPVQLSRLEYELTFQRGPVTVKRYLQLFDSAPAVRWFDTFSANQEQAGMYYSDLASIVFETAQEFKCMNFFSCSDQSNHRLIETKAENGKNRGAFFISSDCWISKEGPMPDCQPIKGEYDFLWQTESNQLEMLGLGFDNLRPGESRRANGVVIGLTPDHGMQRYWLERYRDFPVSAATEVLANSWPDLTFGVNEEAIAREIPAAAEAGINVVFIDDGWFATFMGEIDRKKFPNGFDRLAADAKAHGIELGLWMNPLGLDVTHPKMKLWDGAECHDTMIEKNPWNWLARNPDFVYTEVAGTAGEKRSYAGIELMEPEAFAFRKQQIVDMYRKYGIRHFKFDLYKLDRFNTLKGDAHLHYECYRKLLAELNEEIPELIISMDVTRRERPNFNFALDYGRLFLENRGRNIPDHRYYHPYMALGNFWYTLKYVPGIQMEIEMMPQALDYELEYILGTTIFGAPLYWGCIGNTPADRRKAMKEFYAQMAPLRKKFATYLNTAEGEMPRRGSWSGILSTAPDGSEAYLAVYRNGSSQEFFRFNLPFAGTIELIRGEQAALAGDGMATLKKEFSFALFRLTR